MRTAGALSLSTQRKLTSCQSTQIQFRLYLGSVIIIRMTKPQTFTAKH